MFVIQGLILRHVPENSVLVNFVKVEAVTKWARPTPITEVQFLSCGRLLPNDMEINPRKSMERITLMIKNKSKENSFLNS